MESIVDEIMEMNVDSMTLVLSMKEYRKSKVRVTIYLHSSDSSSESVSSLIPILQKVEVELYSTTSSLLSPSSVMSIESSESMESVVERLWFIGFVGFIVGDGDRIVIGVGVVVAETVKVSA